MARDYCTGNDYTTGPLNDCGIGHSVRIDLLDPTASKTHGKIREIKIIQLDHGYILNVGCKSIALDTPAKILFGLKLYMQNPQKVEEAFLRGEFKFEKGK